MIHLLQVTDVGVAYMCLGGFVVAFSMFSLLARDKLYINEVVLGTAFGILMGPHFAGVFNPRSWGSHSNAITLEAMRVILAIGLFAIGVELPKTYMAKHAKSLLVMIIPTMAIGWFIVAGLIHLLFPQFNFVSCLAIAACLTPTDPIISAAIVGGNFAIKNVPMRLRHLLSAESAANDGLAYPFLTIAIYLTVDATKREAIGHWVLVGCLYQVVLGVFVGVLLARTGVFFPDGVLPSARTHRPTVLCHAIPLISHFRFWNCQYFGERRSLGRIRCRMCYFMGRRIHRVH